MHKVSFIGGGNMAAAIIGGLVFGAQVICDTFKVSGNGGLTVSYDPDGAVQLRGTGLVQ